MATKESIAIKKKQALEYLLECMGILSIAADKIGVTRRTVERWMNQDKKFAEEVEQSRERALDFVESKLFQLIRNDNPAAIFFFLKTKGKQRGYIERSEVESNVSVINVKMPKA